MVKMLSLDNGLTLFIAQNHNVHGISIQFTFRGGVVYESNNARGISHFLEHMFFRRMGKLSQQELYEQINSIGGVLKGSTYRDMICFEMTALSKQWRKAFNIMLPLLDDFTWCDDEIEKERAVVLKQIEFGGSTTSDEYYENQWLKGTKYDLAIMGTQNSVSKFTRKQIEKWKSRVFTSNNACVVIAGDFSDRSCEEIKKLLSEKKMLSVDKLICRGNELPKNFCNRNKNDNILYFDDGNILDVSLMFDIDTENHDEYEICLLSSILGVGDGSRLSMKLREEYAFTDEVFSQVKMYRKFGLLSIFYTVNAIDLIKSLQVVFSEISKLKRDLQYKDLETNLPFFIDNIELSYDNPRQMADDLGYRWIRNTNDFEPYKIANRFANIDLKELYDAANSIFKSSNLSVYLSNNSMINKTSMVEKELNLLRKMIE